MINRSLCVAVAMAPLGLGLSDVQADVVLDFSPTGEYAANFRQGAPAAAVTPTEQTDGSNIFMRMTPGSLVAIYDTTPSSSTVKDTFTVAPNTSLTATVDVNIGTNVSSAGFYLLNPSNESSGGILALMNINSTTTGAAATTERFRVWNAVSNGPNGGIGTLQGGDVAQDAGITTGQLITLTMVYSINGSNQAQISLTAGSYTHTVTLPGTTPLDTFEVALRFAQQGSGVLDFDHFAVTVPEPASMGLVGFCGSFVLMRRRQR